MLLIYVLGTVAVIFLARAVWPGHTHRPHRGVDHKSVRATAHRDQGHGLPY